MTVQATLLIPAAHAPAAAAGTDPGATAQALAFADILQAAGLPAAAADSPLALALAGEPGATAAGAEAAPPHDAQDDRDLPDVAQAANTLTAFMPDPAIALALAAFRQGAPAAGAREPATPRPEAAPRTGAIARLEAAPDDKADAPAISLPAAGAAAAHARTDPGKAEIAAAHDALPPDAPARVAAEVLAHATARAHVVHAPGAEIRAPLRTAGWDIEIGQTLQWMAGEGHQAASLQLNPPDLGPLEIVLQLNGDGGSHASVSFASPHAEVRAALEAALPRLRDMLGDAGIQLGQATVSAESFRERAGQGGGDARERPASAVVAHAPSPAAALSAGRGLIDTFV